MEQYLFMAHDDGKRTFESGEYACRIELSEEQRHDIGSSIKYSKSGNNVVQLFTTGTSIENACQNMGHALRQLASMYGEAYAEWKQKNYYPTRETLENGIQPSHLEEVDEVNKTEVKLKLTDEQIKQIRKMGIEVNL